MIYILSQSGEDISQTEYVTYTEDAGEHSIRITPYDFSVGIYASKERCLEILAEIFKKLEISASNINPCVITYRMPKE